MQRALNTKVQTRQQYLGWTLPAIGPDFMVFQPQITVFPRASAGVAADKRPTANIPLKATPATPIRVMPALPRCPQRRAWLQHAFRQSRRRFGPRIERRVANAWPLAAQSPP